MSWIFQFVSQIELSQYHITWSGRLKFEHYSVHADIITWQLRTCIILLNNVCSPTTINSWINLIILYYNKWTVPVRVEHSICEWVTDEGISAVVAGVEPETTWEGGLNTFTEWRFNRETRQLQNHVQDSKMIFTCLRTALKWFWSCWLRREQSNMSRWTYARKKIRKKEL